MALVFKAGNRTYSLAATAKQRVLDSMERIGWAYINPQTEAIFPLWERLINAVRRDSPLTVKEWTRSVPVRVSVPGTGANHVLDLMSGLAVDREIAAELVTFMTARSYFEGQVLVGSYILDTHRGLPPQTFLAWLQRVGLCEGRAGVDQQRFALVEMARARRHYSDSRQP